jgi:hypothetical protein
LVPIGGGEGRLKVTLRFKPEAEASWYLWAHREKKPECGHCGLQWGLSSPTDHQ